MRRKPIEIHLKTNELETDIKEKIEKEEEIKA